VFTVMQYILHSGFTQFDAKDSSSSYINFILKSLRLEPWRILSSHKGLWAEQPF